MKRKLAAIMFTDIAGFTALSGEDENKALELLDKQKQILNPIIEEFDGTLHKQIGDGLLFTFRTVTDAVKCGIKIQKKTKTIENLDLRIGIHQGEITLKDGDVLGDDVNVASRIESYAAIGGIAISGKVQQDISSLPEFSTKFISQPALKGVKQDVKIYCIISHGLPETDISKVTSKLEKDVKKLWINQKFIISIVCLLTITIVGISLLFSRNIEVPSIGILVLDNYDNNADDYLAYSLTEDLIFDVSGIGSIRVSPMQDILSISKNNLRLNELAKKLDVKYILSGSIAVKNNGYELRCNLIDTESGLTVYQKKWIEPEDNLSNIANIISQDIIDNLNIEVKKDLENISSINSEAYEIYLRGNYIYQNKETEEDIIVAQNLFEESISIDSNLVLSYLKLGDISFDKQDIEKAEEIYNQAYLISESIGDNKLIGYSLQSLSKAYLDYRDYDNFLDANDKSNEIFIQIDDKKGIAENYELKGDMFALRFNYSEIKGEAITSSYWNKAREIYETLGYKRNTANITLKIAGNLPVNIENRRQQIIQEYHKVLKLFQFMGDRAGEAKALTALAEVYDNWWEDPNIRTEREVKEETIKGIDIFLKLLEIYKELNDKNRILSIYSELIYEYQSISFLEEAFEMATQQLDFFNSNFDDIEKKDKLNHINATLRNLYFSFADEENFLKLEDQVYEHKLKAGIAGYKDDLLHYAALGNFYILTGDFKKANNYYYQGLEIALKENSKHDIIDIKKDIANAHFALKEYDMAEKLMLETYNMTDSLMYSQESNYTPISKAGHLGPLYYEKGRYEKAYNEFLKLAVEDSIKNIKEFDLSIQNNNTDLKLMKKERTIKEISILISQYFCLNNFESKNNKKILNLKNKINAKINSISEEDLLERYMLGRSFSSFNTFYYSTTAVPYISGGTPFLMKIYNYYLLTQDKEKSISIIAKAYDKMVEKYDKRGDQHKKYFYDIYWNKVLLEEWEKTINF